MVTLGCKHAFHAQCIMDVFRRGDPKCPVCRNVPEAVHNQYVQNVQSRSQQLSDGDAELGPEDRLVDESIQQILDEFEAYHLSMRETAPVPVIVPHRIVMQEEQEFDPMLLSALVGEDARATGRTLRQNQSARYACSCEDASLGRLRKLAERLRLACVHRGTLMAAIRNAIFARSPHLHALLRSLERDHELFRLRAELVQRAFVDSANERLGIQESVSLF